MNNKFTVEQLGTASRRNGFLIGIIFVVLSIAIYYAGVDINSPIKWIPFVVFVIGIIWSVYIFGKQINYNSTFGNYFAYGFKITALVTSIIIISIIVIIVLFPEIKEKGLAEVRKTMQDQKQFNQEQIDNWVSGMKKFFMVVTVGTTLLMFIIIGALSSLIGAAITKKEPNSIKDKSTQILQ